MFGVRSARPSPRVVDGGVMADKPQQAGRTTQRAGHSGRRRRKAAEPSQTAGRGSRWGAGRRAVPAEVRRQVMERDGWRCRVCGAPATVVDHIVNVARIEDERLPIDPDGLSNLQAMCDLHHRSKTGREGQRARPQRKRPSERHPGLIN